GGGLVARRPAEGDRDRRRESRQEQAAPEERESAGPLLARELEGERDQEQPGGERDGDRQPCPGLQAARPSGRWICPRVGGRAQLPGSARRRGGGRSLECGLLKREGHVGRAAPALAGTGRGRA